MPYGVDSEEQIIRTLERLTNYVDVNCPIRRIDLDTHQPIDGIASDTHFLEMGIPEDRASFAIGKYEHARIPIIRELTKVLQSAY